MQDYTKSPRLTRKARDYFSCIKRDAAWEKRYAAIMEFEDVVPPMNSCELELLAARDAVIQEMWSDAEEKQ
jgi:hypothetical protein